MRRLVTALILLAVGGGAYYYYSYGQPAERPQIVRVTISEGNVTEAVRATGTLEAIRTFPVGSQVSGMVKAVYVDFNSIVKEGQLIAEIDPSLLQVQVDLQEANVARQEGEIANQTVQLEDAQKQLERTQMMFDKGLANQQQLDQAILTVKTRTTALDSARRQLQTVMANLDQAELNVSYTKVYAPIDGVVVNRLVDVGQFVQASMNSPQFFTIATDLRDLKLSAGVDEAEIGKIQRGMAVNFTVDTYPNTTFTGTVEQVRLNATTQSNVVTYPVWINVRNPDLRLRPYLTANVDIIVRTAENVIRVPNQATRFRPTADMYTALGLTPPAPGGRAVLAGASAAAGAGDQARGRAGAPAAASAASEPRVARGDGSGGAAAVAGRGGQTRQGGGGLGANAGLSADERERALQEFSARGGRGGAAGRNGGAGANRVAPPVPLESADKIDELYAPMQTPEQTVSVWLYDDATNALTEKRVRIGISDGQFSQLVEGDIKVGDQVVSNIIIPAAQQAAQQQNIFNQGGGGGRGGFGGGGGGRGGGS
jgi:HlyD family secretion protein